VLDPSRLTLDHYGYSHIEVCIDPDQHIMGNSPHICSNVILDRINSLGIVSIDRASFKPIWPISSNWAPRRQRGPLVTNANFTIYRSCLCIAPARGQLFFKVFCETKTVLNFFPTVSQNTAYTRFTTTIEVHQNLALPQGSQTQIVPRVKWGLKSNPRAALWRWRNNGSVWTLLETAFTSYFLRKLSWVIGKLFLAAFTFVWTKLVHSLAERFITPVID